MADITPTQLSASARISVPFASQIMNGVRSPSREVAWRIYDGCGLRFGHLQHLTDEQIGMLRKIEVAA